MKEGWLSSVLLLLLLLLESVSLDRKADRRGNREAARSKILRTSGEGLGSTWGRGGMAGKGKVCFGARG